MVFTGRTKLILTSGVIFFVIALAVLLIAIGTRRPENGDSTPTLTTEQKKNLLLNQDDRKKAVEDYNSKTGNQGQMEALPEFRYELSPEFKRRIQETKPSGNSDVRGVSTLCNLSEVPESVYVHELRSHWILDEANTVALEYGVNSISYSLPSETTTYQYLFILPDNSASLSLYEGSGVYTYNRASRLAAGSLTAPDLRRYANQLLAQHKLDENVSSPLVTTRGDITQFIYRRNLPDFMLVDEASIQTFFDQENCSVSDSDIMGIMTASVKNNGEIVKFINNTRTTLKSYKMRTIAADVAIQEYKDAQPVDPIVFPAGAEPDPNKPFTIDAAVIAYYDVGLNFAQELYIPFYIAHGFSKSTTGQDIQVLTFFPAVSPEELVAKGVVREIPLPGDHSTQQQGTLPFATPTQHMPPPFKPKSPEIGVSGPGCPGNTTDYTVSCSEEGTVICRGSFVSVAAQDPMKACVNGCSAQVKPVNVTGGTNPCDAIMKENGVTADKIIGPVPNQRIAPVGTEVSCFISACPT